MENSSAQHSEARDGHHTPHVLLVEDYPGNVLVATTFLEQFGYTFDVASTGAEAIDCVKSGTRYAVILMDVQMPVMNGLEATRIIREHEKVSALPRVPIVGMTANAMSGDRDQCLGSGMDDYIAKPFKPDDFEQKLALASRLAK